ncbi:MAG: hypothetical protein UD936_04250 [Acutalibacteraceae bacterium]|nr:hypothetical protein [Acutalibacteraceae bacterium]
MKKYVKEIVILSIQLLMFYLYPLFAIQIDPMGMVFIIIFATVLLSLTIGIISNCKIKYLYPIAVAVLFIPSVFIYYNESALVHSVWYLVVSTVGLLVGIIIHLLIHKLSHNKTNR